MTNFGEYIETLRQHTKSGNEKRHVAQQLLSLHDEARSHPQGVFLELGTDRGQGSRAILAACEENGASLVSVDIRDCSDAVSSEKWTFVQASSIDRDLITARARQLLGGIDMIYVDSLHTPEHVAKEIHTWFDLVKPGGVLFFDDIDSGPYLAGRRKDNASTEIANRLIREVLEDVFYSNLELMDLTVVYGSTGLGIMRKRAGLGDALRPVSSIKRRQSALLAKIGGRLGLRRDRDGAGGSIL